MIEADAPVVILSTSPAEDVADRIARALVEERLAACVTRLPGAMSHYRWRGATESAAEILLLIKTRSAIAPAAIRRLVELHPYDVPEAVVLPIAGGLPEYLAWIRDETRTGEGDS